MAYRNHRDRSFVVGVIDLDKSFETNLIPQGPLSNSPKWVLEVESLGLKWGFEDSERISRSAVVYELHHVL